MTSPPVFRLASAVALGLVFGAPVASQAGDRIEGIVVDVLGQPIPRACIVVDIHDHEPLRAMCDGMGRFVMAHLPRGTFKVTASADGHCANSEEVSDTKDALDASVRIELLDGVQVEGRVVDAGGKPLPAAHVVVDAYEKLLDESETHAVTNVEEQPTRSSTRRGAHSTEVSRRSWSGGFRVVRGTA